MSKWSRPCLTRSYAASQDGDSSADIEGRTATSPKLSLDEIAERLKYDVTDLDEGRYGLESKDVAWAIEIAKVQIPLKPSLGIGLEELRRGRDGRGLVLVSALQPGGNAEASGKVKVGDMVCYLGEEPNRMTRTEGLDFDQTMGGLRSFIESGASSITLVVKRLVFRQTIQVQFSYAGDKEAGEEPWTQSVEMLTGSNLRKEMLRQGFPVYDKYTSRFDQPYVLGDCGGEGLCATCLVQVLEGKELLNEADGLEQMALKKWNAVNWRLSCRCIVGAINEPGTVRLKVTPQKQFNRK